MKKREYVEELVNQSELINDFEFNLNLYSDQIIDNIKEYLEFNSPVKQVN